MITQPRRLSEAEKKRLSYLMEKAIIASFLGHFCFIPLFLWLGIREMVIVNIFSTTLLLASIFFSMKQIFIPAFVISTFEMVIHAVIAVYFIGWGSGFHYHLIVLTPLLFFWPTWTNKAKIGASLLLFVLYISLFLLSQVKSPVYFLDAWQANMALIFNVFIAFAAFAAMSLYYQFNTNEVEQRLREVNSRLVSLSQTDPLTDLHNRRTIVDRMGEEETRSQMNGETFSIIMSDIDHFKTFNDKYGHQFGDQILISVADLLKSATRTKDVVARWGGEEFLILLPNTGGAEAKEVADRMRMVIAQTPLFFDGHEIHITMTFGVAECTSKISINACVELADKALYKGKGNGRNQVVLIKSTSSQSAI